MAVITMDLISPHYGGAKRQKLRRFSMDWLKFIMEKRQMSVLDVLTIIGGVLAGIELGVFILLALR